MDFFSVSGCFLEMLSCKTETDAVLKGCINLENGAMLTHQAGGQKCLAGV